MWNDTEGQRGARCWAVRSPWAKSSALCVCSGDGGGMCMRQTEDTGKKQDGQQSPVVKEGHHRILCS